MFGLFTRPTPRPRNTRHTPARLALRVEALEARANPDANPTLSSITTVWTSATQVIISGIVTDGSAGGSSSSPDSGSATPAVVNIGGAGTPTTVTTNPQGGFSATVNVTSSGPVFVAAAPVTNAAPMPVTVISAGEPTLSNITISQINGGWHIKGQVVGGDPIGTIVTIISNDPATNGVVTTVNPDGSFDIGITPTVGGDVQITVGDGDGNIFDQKDLGFIF